MRLELRYAPRCQGSVHSVGYRLYVEQSLTAAMAKAEWHPVPWGRRTTLAAYLKQTHNRHAARLRFVWQQMYPQSMTRFPRWVTLWRLRSQYDDPLLDRSRYTASIMRQREAT